jgi:hypothetical protein
MTVKTSAMSGAPDPPDPRRADATRGDYGRINEKPRAKAGPIKQKLARSIYGTLGAMALRSARLVLSYTLARSRIMVLSSLAMARCIAQFPVAVKHKSSRDGARRHKISPQLLPSTWKTWSAAGSPTI